MSRSEYDAYRNLAPTTQTGKLRTLDVLAYEAAKLKVEGFGCICPRSKMTRVIHVWNCPCRKENKK